MKKIFIVDSDEKTIYTLQNLFRNKGYQVQATQSVMECMPRIVKFKPDLVLASYEAWGLSSFEKARRIENVTPAAVLFMVKDVNEMFLNGLQGLKVYAYLRRPVSLAEVYRTCEFALNSSKKLNSLQSELEKLEKSLENRKFVERAKIHFMTKYNYSEDEAYTQLRKMSMDKGLPIHELSRYILEEVE